MKKDCQKVHLLTVFFVLLVCYVFQPVVTILSAGWINNLHFLPPVEPTHHKQYLHYNYHWNPHSKVVLSYFMSEQHHSHRSSYRTTCKCKVNEHSHRDTISSLHRLIFVHSKDYERNSVYDKGIPYQYTVICVCPPEP